MGQAELSSQSLMDHLKELRFRIVRILWGLGAGFAICYRFASEIFHYLKNPIAPYLPNGQLVYTGPVDLFMAHIKIGFFGALIVSSPWWMFQIWKFIEPGLYLKEKKIAVGFIFSGVFLFLVGIAFTYFLALPLAFHFLMNYDPTAAAPMITIEQYMGFVTTTGLVFGFAFELPLVIVTLGLLGIISQKFLRANRKYAIVTIAAISAIVTPPDLVSMLILLVPMVFLFEFAVLIVGFFEAKKEQVLEEPLT